jgi:hypothetical protein
MIKVIRSGVVAVLIAGTFPASAYGQAIANPLVRPAVLTDSNQQAPSAQATTTTRNSVQAPQQPESGAGQVDSEELRRQAARRITQEDLNIQQQALNSPVVPAGLVNLFSNMQVTAHIQNAIVMRKVSNEQVQAAVVAPAASQATNGRPAQEPQAATVQNISRSTAVIRLRVGQVVNVAGYSVRAKVSGQDVTVDWLSDKGSWVNVFFGALESSNGGFAQVPGDSQLLEVDTEAFDYLVPKLNKQTFSSNAPGGNQQGNFGSPFGGNSGGNQGFGQPGFGSSAPF